MKRIFAVFSLLASFTFQSYAQIGNALGTGNFGTFNTYSGSVSEAGHLRAYNNGRLFSTTGVSGVGGSKALNIWDASNNITISYGILDNFDVLASAITYQDLNVRSANLQGAGTNSTFSDLYLVIRNGSHPIMDEQVEFGGAISLRVPVGKVTNIPWEVYRSSKIEFGLLGTATYYANPYYKDQAFYANLNFGFWSHNDNGAYINPLDPAKYQVGKVESRVNSFHLQYGLGLAIPFQKVQFMFDAYGISYLTQPNSYVFSRESFAYVTPGIRYNLRNWINVGAYVDVLVSGKSDKTSYSNLSGVTPVGGAAGDLTLKKGVPNYSTWRVGISLGFNILPIGYSGAQTENKRKRLLDRLAEEDQAAQRAATQLDKLRNIRMSSEKELDEIKLELESGGQ